MSKFTLLTFIAFLALTFTNASPGEKSIKYCSDTHVAKIGRVRRIIGDERADPKEFSHMVSLGYFHDDGKKEYICSGSLISDNYVLTTSYCIGIKIPNYVRLGNLSLESDDANSVDVKISRVFQHPEFDEIFVQNDIGLIELESKIKFNDYIRPACLNTENKTSETDSFIATGWGISENNTQSSSLLKITLNNGIDAECIDAYETIHVHIDVEKQICTSSKGKDICKGDGGGPLQKINPDFISTYDIYGITSLADPKCIGRFPHVFTRVSHYIDWIESIVFAN